MLADKKAKGQKTTINTRQGYMVNKLSEKAKFIALENGELLSGGGSQSEKATKL